VNLPQIRSAVPEIFHTQTKNEKSHRRRYLRAIILSDTIMTRNNTMNVSAT